ncbi:DUF4383 domain-containing protein [Nocardia sp. CA-135953]|uniref:DUF4383 domain-containing protein n=1 Tax=unclassified Nocardia TaxID=2637762 RepID=UPI003D999EB6
MAAHHAQTSAAHWTSLRIAAAAVGAVFLVVGVLGFIPGITTNYDSMEWAGHSSDAQLLGLFNVSILHNIVHLVFGVAGLLASRTALASRAFLLGGGIIYLVLWLYGLVIDQHSDANFVPVNTADNWLHFALGVGMVAVGAALGWSGSRGVTGSPRPSIQ